MVMHVDELRDHVRHGSLGPALVRARNMAVHRLAR
jgi:hypothetical protein